MIKNHKKYRQELENNWYKPRRQTIMLGAMIFIILFNINYAFAWSNNTFNNSLTTEILNFPLAGSFTRGLLVPQNTFLINGHINITYPAMSSLSYITSLTNGLVAYYTFDETSGILIDKAAGKNNGTIFGTGIVRPVTGIINTAYNFSVTAGSYINVSIYANTNLNFTNNMSASAWINTSNSGTQRDIVANANYNRGYYLYLNNSASLFADFYTDSGMVSISSPYPIGNGTWEMVSVTANGTDIVLYINDTQVDKKAYDGTILPSPYDTIIGAAANGVLNEQFKGIIDDMGLWNKSLSAIDIAHLYSASSYIGKLEINIGSDIVLNLIISNSTSTINASVVTPNLKTYINSYLSTCTYVDGYCTVPFVFNSTIGGVFMMYNNLNFNNSGFIENSQTFNSSTYETTTESFGINISYDQYYYSSVTGTLVYNNTRYTGTQVGTGNTIEFTKQNLIIPSTTIIKNISFYWEIVLNNGTTIEYYNSTIKNQTVNPTVPIVPIAGAICSGTLQPAFYFDIKDENNSAFINSIVNYNIQYGYSGNPTGKVLNGTLNGVNSFTICINATTPTYTIGYGEIQYYSGGYDTRRFYIFSNTRATNITISNTLYLLNSLESTMFQFTVTNSQYQSLIGYYISLMRWYPEINLYKVVEMGKTDNNGQTPASVIVESVDYRVGVYSTDGNLIYLFSPLRFICTTSPCSYSLFIPGEGGNYVNIDNLQQSLAYNSTSKKFTYIWNDPTEATTSMNLTVYRDAYDTSNIVCSVSGASFTGILTCDVSAYTGRIRAEVTRTASPEVIINQLIVDIGQFITDIAGGKTIGLLISFFLFIFAFLIGIFNPIAAIILGIIALVPALYLGAISYSVFIGVILLGWIVVHFIRRS